MTDITAHDASLVLRHVAGLQALSATQLVAADVNRSGAVTALDAAYILQKSVGLISGTFPGAGKHWDFLPDERTYPLFGNSLQNQDFTAVLIGDVSGNWNSGAGQGQGFDDGSWGAQALATLSLDHAVGNVGDFVSLPLKLSRNGTQPHSLDLQINYDPDRLRFVGITSESDWSSAYRLAAPGELRVAMTSCSSSSANRPNRNLLTHPSSTYPWPGLSSFPASRRLRCSTPSGAGTEQTNLLLGKDLRLTNRYVRQILGARMVSRAAGYDAVHAKLTFLPDEICRSRSPAATHGSSHRRSSPPPP